MNTNEFDEREWQAQERARLAARDGTGPAGDPLAARYRRVAESLRAPLPDALPADFAAQMARRVQVPASVAATPVESRFELGLTRALVGVFGLAGAVVAAMYGAQWLPPILDVLHLESAAADARATMVLVEKRMQARDHPVLVGMPETYYLKCFVLRRVQ